MDPLDYLFTATWRWAGRHEDVWEIDESKREVIKLDPAEVLTPGESGRLLEPLIKPLPAFDSVVD